MLSHRKIEGTPQLPWANLHTYHTKDVVDGWLVAPFDSSIIHSPHHMMRTPYFVKCFHESTFLFRMLLNQMFFNPTLKYIVTLAFHSHLNCVTLAYQHVVWNHPSPSRFVLFRWTSVTFLIKDHSALNFRKKLLLISIFQN